MSKALMVVCVVLAATAALSAVAGQWGLILGFVAAGETCHYWAYGGEDELEVSDD